jgi:hypothetical protein
MLSSRQVKFFEKRSRVRYDGEMVFDGVYLATNFMLLSLEYWLHGLRVITSIDFGADVCTGWRSKE